MDHRHGRLRGLINRAIDAVLRQVNLAWDTDFRRRYR